MNELLQEFIELTLVSERIRSKNFNLSEFKKMHDPEEMYFYVRDKLQRLGVGSARTVWVLSSSKALKLARFNHPDRGRAQNEAEFEISNDRGAGSIIARVLEHDPDFNWIVSQLVRPITEEEFARKFGASFDDVMFALIRTASDIELDRATKASIFDEFNLQSNKRALEFIDAIAQVKKQHDLEMGDITSIDHWGKTADGRIVLLDYGFTSDVMMKHYRKDEHA